MKTLSGPAPDAAAREAEIEEMLAVGEQIRRELAAVEGQRDLLHSIIEDYARGRDVLEALKAGAAEEDVLVPLGGGNYASARLATGTRVVTAIGSGVHVENDVDHALARLADRLESAKAATERLALESRRLSQDMTTINSRLQALSSGEPELAGP